MVSSLRSGGAPERTEREKRRQGRSTITKRNINGLRRPTVRAHADRGGEGEGKRSLGTTFSSKGRRDQPPPNFGGAEPQDAQPEEKQGKSKQRRIVPSGDQGGMESPAGHRLPVGHRKKVYDWSSMSGRGAGDNQTKRHSRLAHGEGGLRGQESKEGQREQMDIAIAAPHRKKNG